MEGQFPRYDSTDRLPIHRTYGINDWYSGEPWTHISMTIAQKVYLSHGLGFVPWKTHRYSVFAVSTLWGYRMWSLPLLTRIPRRRPNTNRTMFRRVHDQSSKPDVSSYPMQEKNVSTKLHPAYGRNRVVLIEQPAIASLISPERKGRRFFRIGKETSSAFRPEVFTSTTVVHLLSYVGAAA
jgi:hypothetical protein